MPFSQIKFLFFILFFFFSFYLNFAYYLTALYSYARVHFLKCICFTCRNHFYFRVLTINRQLDSYKICKHPKTHSKINSSFHTFIHERLLPHIIEIFLINQLLEKENLYSLSKTKIISFKSHTNQTMARDSFQMINFQGNLIIMLYDDVELFYLSIC